MWDKLARVVDTPKKVYLAPCFVLPGETESDSENDLEMENERGTSSSSTSANYSAIRFTTF
jgi:hypothetical protein